MKRHCRHSGLRLLLVTLVITVSGCGPSRWLPKVEALPPPELKADGKPTPPATAVASKTKTILALSGGGSYGAFTAGVINGWTRANNRPVFDIVTGISTGALIAPLAFLGPQHDATIRRFYTEVRRKDVFAFRSWLTVPFRDSLATTAPLRQLVEDGMTPEVIRELAEEHRKARRLYVATTNLQTRKPVVWDLGAIAAEGKPDARKLIIDVLVASAAVPAVFPPVPIEVEQNGETRKELHVDGGVNSSVFVPEGVLEKAAGADLFVILAHKPYPDASKVKPRLLRVLGASGSALIHAHARSDVSNLYYRAIVNKVNFRVTMLDQDFEVSDSAIEFDQPTMNKLFVEGVRVGVAGPIWDTKPVYLNAEDQGPIRTGTELRPKTRENLAKP